MSGGESDDLASMVRRLSLLDEPSSRWQSLKDVVGRWWYQAHIRYVLRPQVVRTRLATGWHDVDEVMFQACFALLGRYVEGELGHASIDDPHQHKGMRRLRENGTDEQAIDLWRWYELDLPDLVEADDLAPCAFASIETIKSEKLGLLMDLRRHLWT